MIKQAIVRWTSEMKAERFTNPILKYWKSSKSILDVGCGDMIITRHIQDKLPPSHLHGIDVIDYRLSEIPFTKYDGKKIPFKSNSFDSVYSILTLHHCTNEWEILREMIRVAKRNIILIEEVYENKIELEYTKIHDIITNRLESLEMSIPLHFHTEKEWIIKGKEMGCSVVEVKRVWQYPWWMSMLLCSLTNQKIIVFEKS